MTRQPMVESGPSLRATPLDSIGEDVPARLLTPKQRQLLASLSTRVSVAPRTTVYRERTAATAVFICSEGAVKSFRELPSGKRRVAAFLFKDDMFGLAEHGRYVNTTQTLMKTVFYRIPLEPLRGILRKDPELQFQFLCKVVHELREQQLRIIVMGRRSAPGRVAMFLTMLEKNLYGQVQQGTIPLPMTRSDIAGYLGLSLEAVSRACGRLADTGILEFPDTRSVRVVDRKRLDKLAADV